MTTDCTRCGAATAAHMLTAISKMRCEEDRRGARTVLLCPGCWEDWLEAETEAAVRLEQHPGRPGPKRRVAS